MKSVALIWAPALMMGLVVNAVGGMRGIRRRASSTLMRAGWLKWVAWDCKGRLSQKRFWALSIKVCPCTNLGGILVALLSALKIHEVCTGAHLTTEGPDPLLGQLPPCNLDGVLASAYQDLATKGCMACYACATLSIP